jgi:hypothetical protein
MEQRMQPEPPRIPPHPSSWLDAPLDPNLPPPSPRTPQRRGNKGLLIALVGVLLLCVGCVSILGIGGLVFQRSAASSGFFPTVQAAIAATLTATAGPPPTPIISYQAAQTTPRPTSTPGPTRTPTPTLTPRPTGTATPPRPTATAIPQVELATRNVNTYRDAVGALWVVGELVNAGQLDAGDIEISVTLLGEGGQPLDTRILSFLTVGLPILRPGEATVWRGQAGRAPDLVREVQARPQAKPVSSFTRSTYAFDLQAAGVVLHPSASQIGSASASGQVVNTSAVALTQVQVVVAAYDESGTLLRVEQTLISFRGVSPGGQAPFAVTFSELKQVPPRYEIYLSGRK